MSRFTCWFFSIIAIGVVNIGSSQNVIPSQESGFYEKGFELSFQIPRGATLYFSTNAEDPTKRNQKYVDQTIEIGSLSLLPPRIDTIPTTPLTGPWQLDYFRWCPPKKNQNKVWIVRYALFLEDSILEENALTYFIGEEWRSKHNFPIISLVTDNEHLYNQETGLFVPGINFSVDDWDENFFGTGNYNMKGKQWQRPGTIEIFDQTFNSQYNSLIDYRIHGAVVGVFPQKSIRVYTDKSKNGKPLPTSIFNTSDSIELTRFILRNSGSDFVSTHFRDAFLHSVASKLNLDYQKSFPTVVYINGNYWGVLNLRERIDSYYIESHHGVTAGNYDMVEGTGADVLQGSNEDFIALLTFIYENDMTIDSNYTKIIEQIDLSNYIDYNIFQTFFCNMDWPGNNVKFWKTKNGKWRWIFFDGDLMMSRYEYNKHGGANHNAIDHATTTENNQWYNSSGSTFLLRNLMANETFQYKFKARYEELASSILSSEVLITEIERFRSNYESEMQLHIQRWSYPKTIESWEGEVDSLKNFVIERPLNYKNHLEGIKNN